MREDILQCVCELESINIAQAELNMSINDKLCKAQNLATQVEGISEARLFALLRSKRLHWLQVHIIVEMQVVQVLKKKINFNVSR
jgi:hypothetical protein